MEQNKKTNSETEFVFCSKCGTKNERNTNYCVNCGETIAEGRIVKPDDDDVVRCPQCGSKNVEFVTYQAGNHLDGKNACIGWLLCGPIGLLLGNKKTDAKTVRKCKMCGKEF